MMKKQKDPQYHMTVSLSGDRKSKHAFHTYKSARHYAKDACENQNVKQIIVTGPDIPRTELYCAA